jgi:hypothetical protein
VPRLASGFGLLLVVVFVGAWAKLADARNGVVDALSAWAALGAPLVLASLPCFLVSLANDVFTHRSSLASEASVLGWAALLVWSSAGVVSHAIVMHSLALGNASGDGSDGGACGRATEASGTTPTTACLPGATEADKSGEGDDPGAHGGASSPSPSPSPSLAPSGVWWAALCARVRNALALCVAGATRALQTARSARAAAARWAARVGSRAADAVRAHKEVAVVVAVAVLLVLLEVRSASRMMQLHRALLDALHAVPGRGMHPQQPWTHHHHPHGHAHPLGALNEQ